MAPSPWFWAGELSPTPCTKPMGGSSRKSGTWATLPMVAVMVLAHRIAFALAGKRKSGFQDTQRHRSLFALQIVGSISSHAADRTAHVWSRLDPHLFPQHRAITIWHQSR